MSKTENGLIKHYMTRKNNLTTRGIETSITFVRRGISKEYTRDGSRREFVLGGGRHVWIAKVT